MTDKNETAVYDVRNRATGPRYVNTPHGRQVAIAPGKTESVELTAGEYKSAKARGDFEITKTKKAAAATQAAQTAATQSDKAAAKSGGEGAGDDKPVQLPEGLSHVAHGELGRYYGFTADGAKVDGLGPWKKEEAQTWATENKVDFKG